MSEQIHAHATGGSSVDDPFGQIRTACSEVAARARSVHIDDGRLERYAEQLPHDELAASAPTFFPRTGDGAATVAFVLTLDTINFGSGWFPILQKRPGLSGYRTVEAALRERFEEDGPLSAEDLRASTAASVGSLLGQDPDDLGIGELMELYARAWRDLGEWLRHFGDDFSVAASAAGGSAATLVQNLVRMPLFRDVSRYDELRVPFLKRAQLTAADLALAQPRGAGLFRDLDRLTSFADNLVPHVLRLDGVLRFDAVLAARVAAGELLPHGSPEEVEIRACAVHAVERLAALTPGVGPWRLDMWLWARGGGAHYKAQPRHRTRCTDY